MTPTADNGVATVGALLRAAAARIDRLDAELLLAHLLGCDRWQLLMSPERPVPEAARYDALVARRAAHEPLAYITGEKEFWSLPLRVTPATLIPRPDSETLIAAALAAFAARPPARVLDLGTGSGALLLAALSEWPEAEGVGVDRSAAALAVAARNARALGMERRARFLFSDWDDQLSERFDLMLCNPPYIPDATPLMPDVAAHEPALALFGGADGLDPYRRLIPRLDRLLTERGVALFEFGEGQADVLSAMARSEGYAPRLHADLAGRPRALELRRG